MTLPITWWWKVLPPLPAAAGPWSVPTAATFSNCTFDHNQAIGGNGNTGSGPVVHVGAGFGAGIFSGFGGVDVGGNPLGVRGTTFSHNTAAGGDNNSGTATV